MVLKSIILLLSALIYLTACSSSSPEQENKTAGVSSKQTMTRPAVADTPQPTTPPTPIPADTAIPEPSPTAEVLAFTAPDFIFQGADPTMPIISRRPTAEIDNSYINPGALLFHEGRFHVLFNSFTSWPGVIEVGYMTSADGITWELAQEAPVFSTDKIPFGNGHADVSSMIILEDGTWVMYFHTIQERQIGLATAASPFGPWEVAPQPVLSGGSPGAWDEQGLSWPNVVYDGQNYRMYYNGQAGSTGAIGLATSPDGLKWTKYDDPATADTPFAKSDPVLVSNAEWDLGSVDRPRVQLSPQGWVMVYAGKLLDRRGLALSDDGLVWETYPENPILTAEDFPNPGHKTWDTALLYHDGAYYYIMELGTLGGTDLYLAIHNGSLVR